MPENVGSPDRILLIRPSALGDVCRTVPLLASLRRAYPQAQIDWLVQKGFEGAIEAHPAFGHASTGDRRSRGGGPILFDRTRFRGVLGPRRLLALRAWLKTLREARYDLVIDAQGLLRSGIFAWATHAPRRVGFANARELGWLALNERHDLPASMHTVDRMLGLIERAGVPPVRDLSLHVPASARAWADAHPRLGSGACLLIAPTSRWAGKRWPIERFVDVARWWLGTPHAKSSSATRIVIVGGRGEREQCLPLIELAQADGRVVDLIGETSVAQLMAVIERAGAVLASDSAALHMAVGLDRPAVGLYGPTRLDLVGPYVGPREPAARSAVITLQHCRENDSMDHKNDSAGREMMARINAEEVIAAVARVTS